MKQGYFQQGDCLVKAIEIPKEAKKTDETILAYGEVTGHAHRLHGNGFTCFRIPDQEGASEGFYLRVSEPTMLKHEEHNPIEITPGDYKIEIVREYDHFEKMARRVAD